MSTTQVTSTDHPGSKGPRIHQRKKKKKKTPWLASRFKLFAFKRRCTLFHQFLCLVSSERSNFMEGFMEKIGILNHQLQWFHGTHLLVSLALRRQPPALSQIQCRSHKSTEQLLNQSPIYIIYQLKHAKSFNLCMLFWMSPKKKQKLPVTHILLTTAAGSNLVLSSTASSASSCRRASWRAVILCCMRSQRNLAGLCWGDPMEVS